MLTAMSLTIDLDVDSATLKKYINMLTMIHDTRLKDETEDKILCIERIGLPDFLKKNEETAPLVEEVKESPKDASPKILCECGIEVIKKNLKRHMTSKAHINNLKK